MPNAERDIKRAMAPVTKAVVDAVANSPEISAAVEDAIAFEARIAPRMGGAGAEDLRTLLGFVIGRLIARGAELDAIDEYVAGALAQIRAVSSI